MPAQFPLQQRMRRFLFVCLWTFVWVCSPSRVLIDASVFVMLLNLYHTMFVFPKFSGGESRPMLNKKRRGDVKASNWSSATVLSRDMHRDSCISSLSAVSDNCCAPSFPCTSVGTAWPHQDWLSCNFQLDTRAPLHTHTIWLADDNEMVSPSHVPSFSNIYFIFSYIPCAYFS